jgi:hypothetical protein
LIADVLTVRGASVEHITGAHHTMAHRLTPFAKVHDGHVIYPGPPAAEDVASHA